MYILAIVLFLIAGWPIFMGWKAMVTETSSFLKVEDRGRKEAGVFGLTGAFILAIAAYILTTQPIVVTIVGIDSVGWGIMMWAIAVITGAMCGLALFSKTKLAFWVDNQRWPSDEENTNRNMS